ncbi:FAD-binding domain-containing protein [Coprinellus micaceus]|uniref:FAD-binding domain-containing protein n=1 Tax=Coprinellus micaceus TaxID=71717 RepID=A0A4Y7SMF2_COPMI|nr:FAD-binding domain-containing protein [Coprinellus micaceus]
MIRSWGIAIAIASAQGIIVGATYSHVCKTIAEKFSTPGAVYYPGSDGFKNLARHWASSSDEVPACVVMPHTVEDVGKTLRIVGRTRTSFAVMGAGHALSPFLSSTTGIHISTAAFTSIKYNNATKRVTFGAGLNWVELYTALQPHGVGVPGARAPGVGVGGFLAGAILGIPIRSASPSTVFEAFELVKPCGTVIDVTHESDPELFFALKGGGNNFFTMQTFPQGLVWRGQVTYANPDVFPTVISALAEFSAAATDPKAGLSGAAAALQGTHSMVVQMFYDGPRPPAGLFDELLAVEFATNTVASQSFLSMIKSIPFTEELAGVRAYNLGVSVPAYSLDFLNIVKRETFHQVENAELTNISLALLLTSEPFLPSILSHNKYGTAYPFTRDVAYTPFAIFVAWTGPKYDDAIKRGIEKIRDKLEAALVEEGYEGVPTSPSYPNYALWDAPLDRIYGSNLPKLQEIKRRVDPDNVMGLAGGFKISPNSAT